MNKQARTLEIGGIVYPEYTPRIPWSEETFNMLGIDTTKKWLAVEISGATVQHSPSATYISKGAHVLKVYRNRKIAQQDSMKTTAFITIPGDTTNLVEITDSLESVAVDPLVGGGDNFKITITRRGGWETDGSGTLLDFLNLKVAKALENLVKINEEPSCVPFKLDTANSMFPYKFDLILTKSTTDTAHLFLFSGIEIRGGFYDYVAPDEGTPYHLDTLWGFCNAVIRDRGL